MHPLARAAAMLLEKPVVQVAPLHGGDLSEVLLLTLADGTQVVAKGGPAPRNEAEMLRAIAAADVPAPRVLAVDDMVLVLDRRAESGGLSDAAWADLGAHLSRLHGTLNTPPGPRYGWPQDYAFARLPIRNTWRDDWPAFWAENRLLPELPHLPAALARSIERIAAHLPQWLPTRPDAALLHGDLWSGNIMADGPRISALIDPACYYGHCEVDLAMLALFATPAPSFRTAYGAAPDGWPTRRAIYQLWPAIVHIRLFGAGYLAMAERLVAQIGTPPVTLA